MLELFRFYISNIYRRMGNALGNCVNSHSSSVKLYDLFFGVVSDTSMVQKSVGSSKLRTFIVPV